MKLFTQIDGAQAIVKLPKGVYKQVQLYHRNGGVYVPHGGGFVEVRYREPNDTYTTGHPDVKLFDFDDDLEGFHTVEHLGTRVLKWRES